MPSSSRGSAGVVQPRLHLARGGRRLGEWLRLERGGLVLLALLVGAGAGGLAVFFRWLIRWCTLLFTGYEDYAATAGEPHGWLPGLGPWFVLFTPVLAGLVYGPLVHLFAREARGHGVPEVMYAVSQRGARIRPQVAGVKALASALCIGGGGSVGREGPIVQIGSALGSTLGRVGRVPEPRMRVLIACGAAGGIAATFNAPLAGVFFAMELILTSFVAEAFGMVVLASVTASAIAREALGDQQFLSLPEFSVSHPQQYLLFALLGVLAGAVGVVFARVLYLVEDGCDWAWRGPEWLRPVVGGFALGGLLLVLPQMYGVGYPVLGDAVLGEYGVAFLLVLLAGKILATSLTIGIGGSGGVFAPSLFMGAMFGSAFGQVAEALVPEIAGPPGAYALLGMGAVFAGAARAPITAIVIMFELTGEYSIILPLMAAIVLATGISHRLAGETIYTLKVRRRGGEIGGRETIEAARSAVGEVMRQVPTPVESTLSLSVAGERLARAAYGVLPVVDEENTCLGILTARGVADAVAEDRGDLSAGDLLVELPATVRPDDDVDHAITALDSSGYGAIPIIGTDTDEVVGWFDYRDALRVLDRSRGQG